MQPADRRGSRLRPPFGHPGEPRLDELEAVEEPQDVRQRPYVQLRRRLAIDVLRVPALFGELFGFDGMGDDEVAARDYVVAVGREDAARFRLVGDEVQRARA